jgi:uncharacterized protein with von Willebrand factor type A (vWA) domain
VDLVRVGVGIGEVLRREGVPVSVDRVERFVRAVGVAGVVHVEDLYWVGRVTLLSDRDHVEVYDRVFGVLFRGRDEDPADFRGDGNGVGTPAPAPSPSPTPGRRPSASDGRDGQAEREVDLAFASREERLATTDFAALTDEELRELRGLMRDVRLAVPLRPARRHRRHPHGPRLDLRATVRRSRRTGGDPVEHVTTRARRRPRRLVVLCDISGSMAPYSRACIQMLHAAASTGGPRAEVFTFATRLTRLTRALAVADPDTALARAGAAAPDWNGGTRIGASLKTFVDDHGRRGVARGAVVVIVSDGWDRDDPELVGQQMQRLRRLAHRIVWINPRTAAPGYAPLAGGMAAAVAHCDELVSGHTLASLRDAMAALAR